MKSFGEKINSHIISKSFSSPSIEKASKGYLPFYTLNSEVNQYSANNLKRKDRMVPPMTLRRMYKNNPIVFVAINTIINEVVSAKFAIVPDDVNLKLTSEEHEEQKKVITNIEKFLKNPNNNRETIRIILEKLLKEILILDAGIIEKVKYDNRLTEIYTLPGDSIVINADKHGSIRGYKQILEETGLDPIDFGLDDLIYIMMNPSADTLYGYSPLEALHLTVNAYLFSERFNLKFFENYAIPKGILDLGPGATEDQLDRFRELIKADHSQQPHKMMLVGGASSGVKFSPLMTNPKDMEMREYQEWLMKMILMVFGISPSEVGLDSSYAGAPATGALLQSQAFRNKAIYPMMDRLSTYITKEIVNLEFKRYDLKFDFVEQVSEQEKLQKRTRQQMEIGMGLTTIEEIRKEEGKEDLSDNSSNDFEGISDDEMKDIINRKNSNSGSTLNEFKDNYYKLKDEIKNLNSKTPFDEKQKLLDYMSQQYNSINESISQLSKSQSGIVKNMKEINGMISRLARSNTF